MICRRSRDQGRQVFAVGAGFVGLLVELKNNRPINWLDEAGAAVFGLQKGFDPRFERCVGNYAGARCGSDLEVDMRKAGLSVRDARCHGRIPAFNSQLRPKTNYVLRGQFVTLGERTAIRSDGVAALPDILGIPLENALGSLLRPTSLGDLLSKAEPCQPSCEQGHEPAGHTAPKAEPIRSMVAGYPRYGVVHDGGEQGRSERTAEHCAGNGNGQYPRCVSHSLTLPARLPVVERMAA